ncbi:MAG: UDP-N-acetylmuramate dehydrogenase [Clostridiales bacterium]|nr:UDP-N-acetylmuramate dehydrogenase [Clostridiales bacterium]
MLKNIEFIENVELKNYSTMKIGGAAKIIVFPKNHYELKTVLKNLNGEKFFVLGNGSKVLFDDSGFDGTIISLKKFNKIVEYDNKCLKVGAGVNLFALNRFLANKGLSGLEWSYGIPATVGGAIFMNAGSFGHEICESLLEVEVLKDGKVQKLKRKDISFQYRRSNLDGCIILYAKFRFRQGSKEEVELNMKETIEKKYNSQPCNYPSLGSVFKIINEKQVTYPSQLIDKMGLKGVKIGGAEISKKHAGFIINTGDATAKDVLALVEFIEEKLLEEGFKPEREIVFCKD